MKKLNKFLLLSMFMASAIVLTADRAISGDAPTLDDALKNIQQGQGLKDGQSINCDRVTNQQFENLGTAFLNAVHPDQRQQEFMNSMMGAKGFASQSYMRRMMGARYLGCNGIHGMGYGMMWNNNAGYGGMGPGMMRYWSQADPPANNERRLMMGYYGYGPMMGFGMGWLTLIFWVVVIIALCKLLCRSKDSCSSSSGEKPLDILKKRYAKGEITKEDFDRIKKDLES